MKHYLISLPLMGLILFSVLGLVQAQDERLGPLVDDSHYTLKLTPVPETASEWEVRKQEVRETVMLRNGLWPMPEKTPLNPHIFDTREGDGFTVSKVYFESLPGFFVTGNLYRPAGGEGPYPAILTPHGHWEFGRLQNSDMGSIPGRCIDFARMGFVTLSIDMVGYNDSCQLPHIHNFSLAQRNADEPVPYEPRLFRGSFLFPEAELYGFSLCGLQTWNGIRSIDFLTSLDYVDPDRIGVTGASGGATQTILLMTVDDRVKVAAPVNIIGAAKHPGCKCENAPGLWLTTSTVELAASFAPKPLMLISATEDPWTNKAPEREYPIIRRYYDLYDASANLANSHVNAAHNYNADSRAAVYEWFCRYLQAPESPIADPLPVSTELKQLGDLRVFPDKMLPENALSGREVMENWKVSSDKAYERMLPRSRADYSDFAVQLRHKLAQVLAVEIPDGTAIKAEVVTRDKVGGIPRERVTLSWNGVTGSVPVDIYDGGASDNVTVLVSPETFAVTEWGGNEAPPLVRELTERGSRVMVVRGFASGQYAVPRETWDSYRWPEAHNRTNELNAVQDIVTAIRYAASSVNNGMIHVAGLGGRGIYTAFAAALCDDADTVTIDLDGTDPGNDAELVTMLHAGAIKRVGDFRTAYLLLLGRRIDIVRPGTSFDTSWYGEMAARLGMSEAVRFVPAGSFNGMSSLLMQ